MQAPYCLGECPPGWTLIKRRLDCPDWDCDGAYFGRTCVYGAKALCERCT